MRKNRLFYNGRIHTQADSGGKGDLVVDSIAVSGTTIIAAGNNLKYDSYLSAYDKIDLKGHTVIPGLVDAHTHIHFLTLSMDTAHLDGLTSLEDVLKAIATHVRHLKKDEWVTGDGFAPERWKKVIFPDRFMLDRISGGRPAVIWSKDNHLIWANSRALEIGGIDKNSVDPPGGRIERLENGEPSGILKEIPAYFPVVKQMAKPSGKKALNLHNRLVAQIRRRGVTAVHSMDRIEALPFYMKLSESKKLGLRIDFYPPGSSVSELRNAGIKYGYGNDYFRVSGLKMFADGALGSKTALCFNKYIGSKNNYGIEVTPVKELVAVLKRGARLGLPCAVHAIGDRAVANALDAFEHAPRLRSGGRHRIEHLQMIRRKDIPRLKRLGIVASMQPSHCPSDIMMIGKFWGGRGRNCYIFKTLLERGIPLAFGSDAPIEPLDPIAGIHDVLNRRATGVARAFYPEERLSVQEAVYNFTAGPAFAVGQEHRRGYLLPGYKADFVILSDNIYRIARSKVKDIEVRATIFDGHPVYSDGIF